ncbi:hypothetical protein ACPA9J_00505 [Pseudomonas aeruginosa]
MSNLKDRPRQPVQRRGDDLITLNAEQAHAGAADILRQSKKVIGIGSPRASIESNFALRELVGADNFYTGIAKGEQARLQHDAESAARRRDPYAKHCAISNPTMRYWYWAKTLPRPAPALPWQSARR